MKGKYLIIVVLLLGVTGRLHAQEARHGTSAAAQLMVPLDARFLGGGGAAASVTSIESVLWNPAGLDQAQGDVLLMLSRRNYIADIGVNFAGVGLRFGGLGAIAVHIRSFDMGQIDVTDEFNMDGTGERISPVFFTIGATYSRLMTDRISAGVTTNVIHESFANVTASGVTFDAGVQYREFLGVGGLQLGVAIRNIGSSMRYDGSPMFRQARATDSDRAATSYKVATAAADMPTVVDLGISYRLIEGLNVGVTYMENTYGPSEIRSLLSYDFQHYGTIRGSFNLPVDEQDELENIFNRPSIGATINLQPVLGMNVSFDYGFMAVKYFDANHMFTLRGEF
jgi:hypothetical protein